MSSSKSGKFWIACVGSVAMLGGLGAAAVSTGSAGAAPEQSGQSSQRPTATPGEQLTAIASKIGPAVPVPAGKVSYLDERGRHMATDENGKTKPFNQRSEVWAPSNQKKVWELRQTGTSGQVERNFGRCGDFFAAPKDQCKYPGDWQSPKPEWLAGLPRDGQAMLERLKKDRADNDRNDIQLMVEVTDMLGNPAIPADVRAAVFKAIAKIPGLRAVPAVDLLGRKAMAFGVADDSEWHEVLVDPATGNYLGERQVARKPFAGVKPGETVSQNALEELLVNKVGQRP
ncbi:CU044_5270 family protein [Kribbella deserti]|uniref:CU044_5270 family protein n=1 Tax=Kribbella deserti TaxID=1926257 RepID=A0ABV6QG11_9ACTN